MSEQDKVADDAMQARLRAIATEFGGGPPIRHPPGGMGHSYRVASVQGPLVIKPAPHPEEAQWLGATERSGMLRRSQRAGTASQSCSPASMRKQIA